MHWMEWEERQQLAEELAARGICLEEGREWFEVGMVEVTEEEPPEIKSVRLCKSGGGMRAASIPDLTRELRTLGP